MKGNPKGGIDELKARRAPEIVHATPAKVLAVGGHGAPGGAEFQAAVSALYSLIWTIKMARKARGGDVKIPPLEGLWWGGGSKEAFLGLAQADWKWKIFLRLPESVSAVDLRAAQKALVARGRAPKAKAKLEVFDEGDCVQALHVGSYASEPETIARMESFAREHGFALRGRHHEIYWSDPSRTAPARLKTTLRHPLRPA